MPAPRTYRVAAGRRGERRDYGAQSPVSVERERVRRGGERDRSGSYRRRRRRSYSVESRDRSYKRARTSGGRERWNDDRYGRRPDGYGDSYMDMRRSRSIERAKTPGQRPRQRYGKYPAPSYGTFGRTSVWWHKRSRSPSPYWRLSRERPKRDRREHRSWRDYQVYRRSTWDDWSDEPQQRNSWRDAMRPSGDMSRRRIDEYKDYRGVRRDHASTKTGSRHDRRNPSPRNRGNRRKARSRSDSFRRSKSGSSDSRSTSRSPSRNDEDYDASASRSSSKTKKKGKKQKDGKSDSADIVHYSGGVGDFLGPNGEYEIMRNLGEGTFGRVVMCRNKNTGDCVAIKVIRDVPRYKRNAVEEAEILEEISSADPEGSRGLVKLLTTFEEGDRKEHYCMVFPVHGASIYDVLKLNGHRGYRMRLLQYAARSTLEAMAFCHEDLKLTHTDLKPENILWKAPDKVCVNPPRRIVKDTIPSQSHSSTPSLSPKSKAEGRCKRSKKTQPFFGPEGPDVCVIDFGNATFDGDNHSTLINTRQYRGPEIILGSRLGPWDIETTERDSPLPWDQSSDIWSLGCIFAEMYTGEMLLPAHDNQEHLAMMERVLGRLPDSLLSRAHPNQKAKLVTCEPRRGMDPALSAGRHRLRWPEGASSEILDSVDECLPLERYFEPSPSHQALVSLIRDMLTYEPKDRPSCKELLKHHFFLQKFDEDE